MIEKVYLLMACLAHATGTISRTFSITPTVSQSYTSLNNPVPIKTYATPAPIYEESSDVSQVSQQASFFDTLNVPFAAGKNINTPTDVAAYTLPDVHSYRDQIFFNPTLGGPHRANNAPGPLAYITNARSPPLLKPVSTPNVATTPGLSAYASQTPQTIQSQALKSHVKYSEASAVSHTSFTGFGTSYAW